MKTDLKFGALPLALAACLTLSTPTFASEDTGPAFEPADYAPDEFGVLFHAPGVEETYAYCAACHSERIVAQQGLTRDGWVELIDWMIEDQGMVEIDEPDLTYVLDYLSEHYGEDRPNFPGKKN